MSVHYEKARDRYVVRWREAGRNRSSRFRTLEEAEAFDATRRRPSSPPPAVASPLAGSGGVYPYETKNGTRFRVSFRQSDGSLSTRRGFTSRRAATIARRRLVESVERGEVKVARETFGTFWLRLLEERRPYLTKGSFVDNETHGRKRLLPTFGDTPLARLDETAVRVWMAAMVKEVALKKISPATVNNARTCLSVALNEATRRGLIARNPCAGVPALPVERQELDYLRLDEIEPYLAACRSHYRPLAHCLVGTGARISEALALQFRHLALDDGVVRIYRQRAREGDGSQATKG